MESVSKRAKNYKQPQGGFIPIYTMDIEKIDDGINLYQDENIHPSLVGLVVDYMSRYLSTKDIKNSFAISIIGANIIGMNNQANELLKKINGLDRISIISACKLVGFDCVARAGINTYKPIEKINPNDHTIFNIIIMIKRTLTFFEKNGPVVSRGMTFSGAYTSTINSGDADLMTIDTIWNIKVSKHQISPYHTLQVLIYYLMGCRTNVLNEKYNFKNKIKKIGIYNPRLNISYVKDINKIENEVLNEVKEKVICYKEKENNLTVTDLMKLFSTSRYTIMKYYSLYNLPLKKIKNKYYISEIDLKEWIITKK